MSDQQDKKERFGGSRKGLDRRDLLKLCGAALAGGVLVGIGVLVFREPSRPAPSLGIRPGNPAGRNRGNLVKALTGSAESITFPRGDYRIDNSGEHVIIRNFGGKLTMEPGARFVFTDDSRRGLMFEKGSGARFYGLRTAFASLPPSRVTDQQCVLFVDTTDTLVRGAGINGSAGAGMLFARCVRPSVSRAVIKNTRADGLHFSNCQDAKVVGLRTRNTGDDGLAFLNYAGGPDNSGGTATDVIVEDSGARGITVVGQSDVTVRDFSVQRTAGPGIYCAREASYSTRTPSKVRFVDGLITGAGEVGDRAANGFGIEFYNVGSAEFDGIEVTNPAGRGVSGSAPEGLVRLSRVRAKGAPGAGFHVAAGDLYLDELTAEDSGGTGIAILNSGRVRYGELKTINVAKRDAARRAFNFEGNGRVEGTELTVIDTQEQATGYKVRTDGEQSGTLGRIRHKIENKELEVDNRSNLSIEGRSRL